MAKQGSYGLKEVADVRLYPVSSSVYPIGIDASGNIAWSGTAPTATYTFDSLKVSTLEMSAQEASARGGKGNPERIIWQYGKELKLSCEDALLNLDTLSLMFGGNKSESGNALIIDANTFNENYAITGLTKMRSYESGADEDFLFFLPKANVKVGGTLTMQADGDPSTFSMEIKALSAEVGTEKDVLIKFMKATGDTVEIAATGSTTVNWKGASTVESSYNKITGAVSGDVITLTATAEATVGSVATITVKGANSTVLGTFKVNVVAQG